MSVAAQLDLDDPDRGRLAEARRTWPQWCETDPRLGVVTDLVDLPPWIAGASKAEVDDVLLVLARLASPTGGDDVVAAGALAWLLLPGIRLVAKRLRRMSERIDEVVAAQLWLEVRSFDWRRRRKVAANIVWNTRRGVLRELGVGEYLREVDPTWAGTVVLDSGANLWGAVEAPAPVDPDPSQELAEVLTWAVDSEVIAASDRDLLLALADAADAAGVRRSGCGQAGLCSREVSRTVGAQRGISEATVRRRVQHSVHAMSAARAKIPA